MPVSYFSEIHSVSQFNCGGTYFFVQLVISTITFFLARCPLARLKGCVISTFQSSVIRGKQSSRIRKFLMSYFHAQ